MTTSKEFLEALKSNRLFPSNWNGDGLREILQKECETEHDALRVISEIREFINKREQTQKRTELGLRESSIKLSSSDFKCQTPGCESHTMTIVRESKEGQSSDSIRLVCDSCCVAQISNCGCGAKPELGQDGIHYWSEGASSKQVHCPKCQLSSKPALTHAGAILAWNDMIEEALKLETCQSCKTNKISFRFSRWTDEVQAFCRTCDASGGRVANYAKARLNWNRLNKGSKK